MEIDMSIYNDVDSVEVDEETLAREKAYRKATATITGLGYYTIQETICESLQLGVIHKTNKTWEPVKDVTTVASDRIVISKAQAKQQGLEILTDEDS